ncbi:hypothetical protein [Portibacter marinus]|uniref:hypothetical protein n=1 Tax=Portibacter marinus TaxID=2898660 RepID=UPI001F288821|nr:hypothetical protein [Portibacter marinus]
MTKENIPTKKDGWNFNWRQEFRQRPSTIFVLIEKNSNKLHGVIQLVNDEGMLIMELIEVAPINIGSTKENDRVAGCLIAFGCKESLKLENAYKGYLTFVSKTSLIDLYKTRYYATQTIGQRMYIDPISGEKLINKYLK